MPADGAALWHCPDGDVCAVLAKCGPAYGACARRLAGYHFVSRQRRLRRIETIIEDAEGYAWFQLYADQSGDFVDELVGRAEASDYEVLILTVDVPIPSVRTRDLRNGFTFPLRWGAAPDLGFRLASALGRLPLWPMQ